MIEPDDEGGDEDDVREPWANFLRSWRIVEYTLDVCIMLLFERYGDQILETDTPISLKSRILFLKRAYDGVEELRPFRATAASVIARLKSHQTLRNDIVHGIPVKVEPDGTTHIVWPQLWNRKIHYHRRVVRRRQWDDFAANNGAIIGGLMILYFGLLPPGPTLNEGQDVDSELPVKALDLSGLPASKKVRDLFHELAAGLSDD